MDEYRQFWNEIYYGTEFGFAGADDITEYWLRMAVVVTVGVLAGIASSKFRWLPVAMTSIFIGLWFVSVGPFVVWAARCGGCGSSTSYDSARSYEAMIINQAWGGLLATAIASVWIGTVLARRLR